MNILYVLLVVVEVVSSIILILLVLMQKSKGGLGLAFGSGTGDAIFGARAGNVLTRATVVFAIVFLANTLGLAMIIAGERNQGVMSSVRSLAPAPQQQQAAPAPEAIPEVPAEIPTEVPDFAE